MKLLKNLLLALFVLALYFLTIRGNLGNPTASEIDLKLNKSGMAFETSQERSRYAILLSLVNYNRFDLGEYASMGTPDIGISNGKYYSFFPPATSVLAIPLYRLGVLLGMAQIFTFLLPTIFSILTMVVILKLCLKNNINRNLSLFTAISFGFATNAWGYSVTFYAHLLSAFLVITGIYFASKENSKHANVDCIAVWILYSAAIFVDFPNIFTFLPIAIVSFLNMFKVEKFETKTKLSFNLVKALGPILFLLLMSFYGYYNYVYFGSPLKLSNTISRVKDLKEINSSVPETGSDAFGALKTRSLLNGLISFTISRDRGVLVYTPIALLSLFSIFGLRKSRINLKVLLVGVPISSIVAYSMFGDPYGGWAFGSRYLISILPALVVLSALGLQYALDSLRTIWSFFIKLLYSVVFIYSAAVSLLAPLTTNVIPPYIEAREIGLAYDYSINIRMLKNNELNSFFYNNIINGSVSGVQYYFVILIPLVLLGLTLLWFSSKNNPNKND